MKLLPDPQYCELFAAVKGQVREILEEVSACHDFDHTIRVLHNARKIALETGGNIQVIEIAALCHDIGRGEEINSKGKLCHALCGSKKTGELLKKYDLSSSFITQVCSCVLKHRFRDRNKPRSLEEKIIYDADKLDSVGAVGIGRAFYFAGREGARLHNSTRDALNSDEYSLEDSAYREYLVKLRHIAGRLLTAAAREIAGPRVKFMDEFFTLLNAETDNE